MNKLHNTRLYWVLGYWIAKRWTKWHGRHNKCLRRSRYIAIYFYIGKSRLEFQKPFVVRHTWLTNFKSAMFSSRQPKNQKITWFQEENSSHSNGTEQHFKADVICYWVTERLKIWTLWRTCY